MNCEKPKVSIAIITYNQKDFLKECVESCLAQTYTNIEIVVADDASTDGTQDLLKEYAARYPEIFILKLSKINSGITNNSNSAHLACTGKYIAWMGGDDLMHPRKIETQVNYMEQNPNCSISYHDLEVFDSDSNHTIGYFNSKNKYSGKAAIAIEQGTFNGACSTMVKRSLTPKSGFSPLVPVASDWLYWVETLEQGGEIHYIDEVLGRYRRHSNNITSKNNQHLSQVACDHFNSSFIILKNYPYQHSAVTKALGRNFLNYRQNFPYFKIMLASFVLRPRVKVALAIVLYIFSLGKFKV